MVDTIDNSLRWETEREDMDAAMSYAEKALSVKVDRLLGRGYNGDVYLLTKGDVLKITTASTEAMAMNLVRHIATFNDDVARGVVDMRGPYYQLGELTSGIDGRRSPMFACVMEKLSPVTSDEAKSIPESEPFQVKMGRGKGVRYYEGNPFWIAYRIAHDWYRSKDSKEKTFLAKGYIEALERTMDVPGYEAATEAVWALANDTRNGGPFIVGDFKPINCGRNRFGDMVAFDLYVYSDIPARFTPERI